MSSTVLWDVFLSHSEHDKSRVRRLAEQLREANVRVWFDEWIIKPGDDIYAAIEDGLEYTRTLILCLSQAALASDWVKLERNTTIFRDPENKERRFVPLLLQDCQLPAVLRRLAFIDWRNEDAEEFQKLLRICLQQRDKKHERPTKVSLTPPTGALRSDHPLYIEREADVYAKTAARQPAETIIIKAPRQMGKSSLLISYLKRCREARKKTVLLDLASLLSNEEISDYPQFLTILAREILEQLDETGSTSPPLIERQAQLTRFIEGRLLTPLNGTLLIAFDEMDRILGRNYQEDFFSMLRYWHNQRADNSTGWQKLGLAIAVSSEPYLFIKDVLRSPFNVGLNIQLRLLNEAECNRLNRLYGANLKKNQVKQLMELINGHPHLTQLALYAVSGPDAMDFPSLLQKAVLPDGPFGAHLRALEYRLSDEAGEQARIAMKQVLNGGKPSRSDFYRLQSAGLVRQDGERIVPANELYASFFRNL